MEEEGAFAAIPVERMIAILKYRGMDSEALLLAQRRNLETLVEVSGLVARGIQDIAARQANLLRTSAEGATMKLPDLTSPGGLAAYGEQQIARSRETMGAVLDGFQEISTLAWQCNRQAFELINQALLDSMQSFLRAVPSNGAAGPPADVEVRLPETAAKR